MFYKKNFITFQLLDVLELNQTNVNLTVSARNFDALSYRISANSTFSTKTQTLKLSDGDLCFVPAGVEYTRKGKHDHLIAINLTVDNYVGKRIEKFTVTDKTLFENLFLEILHTWNKKDIGYEYHCASLLNQILRACYVENYREEEHFGLIDASVKYLNEHYTDPNLTVAKLAEQSFISEVYFRKLFKRYFGVSPAKYVVQMRIQHATRLIATGYYSLKEVAFLSGYNDYSYFCAEFKQMKGVPPSQYIYTI